MTSIEKLVTPTNNATTSATNLKNSQNRHACANPLRQLHCDTISFKSKGKYEYIDENDTSLFKDCVNHSLKSFNDLSSDNIILIHKTNFFPEDGCIKSRRTAIVDGDGIKDARSTIHFSLNYPVRSHMFGNWDDMKYVILTPLKSTIKNQSKNNIIGGKRFDFIFNEDVNLPDDTTIVQYNEAIPKGKLRISKDKTTGFRLVESSNKDLSSIARKINKKMGFVDFKDFAEENNLSSEDISTGWNKFCNKMGYINSQAMYLPQHRADSLIFALYNLSIIGSYDIGEIIPFINIDYKKELLNIIEDIKQDITEIELSYDIDKLKEIISDSKDPKEAYENAKKILKIGAIEREKDPDLQKLLKANQAPEQKKALSFPLYLGIENYIGKSKQRLKQEGYQPFFSSELHELDIDKS